MKKPKIVIVLFLQLPNIKRQGKQNEVAQRPAPYDSIQIGTLNNGQPNDRLRKKYLMKIYLQMNFRIEIILQLT